MKYISTYRIFKKIPFFSELLKCLNACCIASHYHTRQSCVSDDTPNSAEPINGCWLVVDGLGRVLSFSI